MKTKIIKFFKKNYLLFVILLVLIIVAIFFSFRKNIDEVVIKEHDLYQYLNGIKVEYTGEIIIDKEDKITQLNTKDIEVELDSNPIYFADEAKSLFPKNMSVIFPTQGAQYKINYYSTVYNEVGDIYIKDRSYKDIISNAILYDGANIYYLIETSTVSFGQNSIKLDALSSITVDPQNQYVGIYNYDEDKYTEYFDVVDEVIIATDKYKVNASLDLMYYNGKSRLLIKMVDKLKNLDK